MEDEEKPVYTDEDRLDDLRSESIDWLVERLPKNDGAE